MSMKKQLSLDRIKFVFVLTITIFFYAMSVDVGLSQSSNVELSKSNAMKEWITFSPPSGAFMVELPAKPSQETRIASRSRDKETDIVLALFKCTKAVTIYLLPSTLKAGRSRLQILHVDVSGCTREPSDMESDIFGFLVVFGGDEYTIVEEKEFTINGFRGRDVVFKNRANILKRTLAIDAGKELFFVSYDRLGGDKGEEERIFRTFKPRPLK